MLVKGRVTALNTGLWRIAEVFLSYIMSCHVVKFLSKLLLSVVYTFFNS